jgi:hypothetical protein
LGIGVVASGAVGVSLLALGAGWGAAGIAALGRVNLMAAVRVAMRAMWSLLFVAGVVMIATAWRGICERRIPQLG